MSQNEYAASNGDSTEAKITPSQHVEAAQDGSALKEIQTTTSENNPNYLKVVHTDGTVNYVDNKAIGGDAAGMPKGYFKSPQFIGTVAVSSDALNT
jgi:hypothetical protein